MMPPEAIPTTKRPTMRVGRNKGPVIPPLTSIKTQPIFKGILHRTIVNCRPM